MQLLKQAIIFVLSNFRYPDGTNSLFGKNKSQVQLKDLKVYHGVYEEGEYIPFTDAEPFALY